MPCHRTQEVRGPLEDERIFSERLGVPRINRDVDVKLGFLVRESVSRATNRGKRLPFTFLVSSPEMSVNRNSNRLGFEDSLYENAV